MNASGPRVGFIGIGDQGEPMAGRIVAAGFPLAVWARRPERASALVGQGATVVASPTELAAHCDVLGICVGDDADVREIAAATLPHLAGGAVLVVHSTVAPQTCVELAAEAARHGVHVVDAPVSGGRARAASGELTVMVGGDPEPVARIRPVLDTFGALVSHLGPVGSGQTLKLLNNLVFTAQLAVSADVVTLARSLGLDVGATKAAVAASTGGSRALSMVVDMGDEVFPRHQDGRERGAMLLAKDNDLARAVVSERGRVLPDLLDRLAREGLRLAVDSGAREARLRPVR